MGLIIDRRKFLRLAAATTVAAVAVDSALLEPNYPRIVRKHIGLRRWPANLDGFTIAQLSDFHFDPFFSAHPLKAAIGLVNNLRPDLIVLTGDFVSVRFFTPDDPSNAAAAEPCAQLLRQMHAPYGMWAVLGNHDFSSDAKRVAEALRAHGVQLLENKSTPIEPNGGRFWLTGVNDVVCGNPDLDSALARIPSDEATVLLAHEPDYADHVARYPVDLQLSGHSHGGQVRFPLLPPMFLPELAQKYVWGLYRIGPLTLYTNPGLGTVGVPIRLNCPPEITLLTLRRAAA